MKRVANYELRSRVFQLEDTEHILSLYKLYRRVEYCRDYGLPLPAAYHSELHDDEFLFLQAFYPSEWSECEKICRSDKERVRRLKIKIRWLVTNFNAHFVRLGFWDKILDKTSVQTRRRYVSRFLDSLGVPYIANIDFGEDNGREHYHAVIGCRVPLERMHWWYEHVGGFNSKRIRKFYVSSIRLSKYVSKLSNHAVKYTCRRGALLYSRKNPIPVSVKKEVAPISAKGNFPGINSLPRIVNNRFNFKLSAKSAPLVARCCMCGSIIPVLPSDMPKHTLTVQKGTKTKKYYFCSDCKELYKVKTDN